MFCLLVGLVVFVDEITHFFQVEKNGFMDTVLCLLVHLIAY